MPKEELEKTKLTKWKNEPSFDDLNNDRMQSGDMQETTRNNLTRWAEYRDGGKKINAKPGKSTVRPKLIRKHNEWRYPAMEEPFLNTADMFEVNPRTAEDVEAAEQNALLLNYQWSTKINKTALVNSIVRTFVDEGTVIVKSGWESEEGIKTVEEERPVYASPEESMALLQEQVANNQISPEEAEAMIQTGQPVQVATEKVYVEKETLVKNQPTYEVCNNANIIIDPTSEGVIENAQFVIHEYSTSKAELNKQKFSRTVEEITYPDGSKDKIITESGIYKNLNEIEESTESVYDEFDSVSANSFKYQDKPRKKLRAFEYWGFWDIHGTGEVVSIVATWIGKTIIRMEENPFPHGELPFSFATYMPVKKEVFGEPDAEVLIDNQDSIGKMTRAAHDITSAHAVGQKFIDEQLFPSPVQRENYRNGNTVFFRAGMDPRTAIHTSKTEDVPNTVFNFIEMQTADADSMSGATTPGAGAGSRALGSSATGIRSALDSRSKRELSILRRLSDLLFKDMARKTISMNQAYLDEEEVIRITNNFVTIRRDDLAGEFDLKIDVSTPEKDAESAEKLNMMLQTNAASMDQEEARMIRSKIAKLWKLPDLAEQIETFEPTPDPVATQLQQMEMEKLGIEIELNKKLIEESDSRIHERISRVVENEQDVGNKKAQQALREQQTVESAARTKKLMEETDALEADFVDTQSGAKRAREMEDKQFDLDADLSKEELKAQIALLQQQLDNKNETKQIENKGE